MAPGGETAVTAALDRVISAALAIGADEAEAYLEHTYLGQVRIFNRHIESVRSSVAQGLGLRVHVGGRQGYAFAAPAGTRSSQALAEAAVAAARQAEPDSCHCLLTRDAKATGLPPAPAPAFSFRDLPLASKIELATAAENAALSAHPRMVATEDVEYLDYDQEIHLLNSHGIRLNQRVSHCMLGVTAVADEGGTLQTGVSYGHAPDPDGLRPHAAGRAAAQRALLVCGARPRPTAEVAVIFAAAVASDLIRVIAPSFNADAVSRGRSRLRDRTGDTIAAPGVTLVDHGNRWGAPAFTLFDGEGVPTRRSVLIRSGRLEGLLRTLYAARRDGAAPTGNGRRRSFRATPEFGPTNFYLEAGPERPEQLYAGLSQGLFVQEVQGLHLANRVSGDFSVGVTGVWIRNGELAEPVRGISVAGNMFELLGAIDLIASDLQFVPLFSVNRPSFGSPSFRVRSMVVSGT